MQANPDCIFCKIVKKELPSELIYEDAHYLVILNIYPISTGHALVIPKAHSQDILEMGTKERAGILDIVAKVAPAIMKGVHAQAFNLGANTGKAAGQAIFHTHLHIIPRKQGDGLKGWSEENHPAKDLSIVRKEITSHL